MKLNYKRTILVGLAFLSISAFWQMYDSVVPLILTNNFNLNETWSGAIMAADNILALFLLPFFGSLSDKITNQEKKNGIHQHFEPQRKFQGQTDVESVSLCLWHPCLLSSGMAAAAATWGKKTRREKCSEPANVQKSYKVFTCSIRREGLHTKGYNNAKMKPLPG